MPTCVLCRSRVTVEASQVQASGWSVMITITVLTVVIIMSLPSVPNILKMWAYLTQATFFHEVIFQMGELRPQKIRQLGQDHPAGK